MVALLAGAWDRPPAGDPEDERELRRQRDRLEMVDKQIAARGVRDGRVLVAMRRVPRHLFVPESEREASHEDRPLRIGAGQTISQPYIVALMSEVLELQGGERVLEIGTGSGYQTAVLAELAAEVYSIEIVPELAAQAAETLEVLRIPNLHLRCGDASRGWPEAAPFDAILLTAAPGAVPPALVDQLAIGGKMVLPVGREDDQMLVRIRKTPKGIEREPLAAVRFVPMTGEAAEPRDDER